MTEQMNASSASQVSNASAASDASDRRAELLSKADIMAILRTTTIFMTTTDEALEDVADLLRPQSLAAGQLLFARGDPGDCMYIVVKGRVRVHDGERVLNDLWAGAVVGEMAILDDAGRVASVTAIEPTQLLRLDEAPFQALMDAQPEIGFAIINVLCQYLRARLRDMAQDFVYLQHIGRMTAAAAALENNSYDPASIASITSIADLAERYDPLGQLARAFQHMAEEVIARETSLRQQVQALIIEIDEAKKARQVAEITETDAFRRLQEKAGQWRRDRRAGSSRAAPSTVDPAPR
ncbi:MAG: cyclic nucleotide-binding domain-containing protein [Anaerolineae bacterium]